MMTKFLLIRHATNDTVGKRFAGRQPGIHLNEEGRLQAQKLAEWLAHLPIAAIYSSPLERAIETAEPIAKTLKLKTESADELIEMDFGEWTNRTFDELADDPQFQLFNSFRSCTGIPGGELMPEAQIRVIKYLQKLCVTHDQQIIAIVTHSDIIKAVVAYYAGIHLDLFQRLEINPASVSIVEVFAETARISLLNFTGEVG